MLLEIVVRLYVKHLTELQQLLGRQQPVISLVWRSKKVNRAITGCWMPLSCLSWTLSICLLLQLWSEQQTHGRKRPEGVR